jgi:WD40 repeat protein
MWIRISGFVAMSPDGTRLATGGWHSHSVRLWNARTGVMEREWETPSLVGIDFTPDSRALVTVQPAECRIWDLESFQAIRRFPREASHYPSAVAFAQDEIMMALEVSPGVVHLVETTTGHTVAKLTDPFNDRATWMSFTPDGTRLVTASTYAKTLHVWNLRLIRKQLKEMDLDWEWPEFPAEPPL